MVKNNLRTSCCSGNKCGTFPNGCGYTPPVPETVLETELTVADMFEPMMIDVEDQVMDEQTFEVQPFAMVAMDQ